MVCVCSTGWSGMSAKADPPAFYDLDGAPLDLGLGRLLETTLADGRRACVRLGQEERVPALDQGLWTYRNDSFLPHGCEGDPSEHPVWVTAAVGNPNGADLLVVVDDASLDSRDSFADTVYLFDRRDPAMRDIARDRFAAFRDEGSRPVYLRFGPDGWPQS